MARRVTRTNPFSSTRQRNAYRRWNTAFRGNTDYQALTRTQQRDLDTLVGLGTPTKDVRARLAQFDRQRREQVALRAWKRRQHDAAPRIWRDVERRSRGHAKQYPVNIDNATDRFRDLVADITTPDERAEADINIGALKALGFPEIQLRAGGHTRYPQQWYWYH